MSFKESIDLNKLPNHIAIIMDGNGRWAQRKGKFRVFGHQNGVLPVKECAEAAADLGVKYLTLYAFSKENWNRPQDEINALMSLLVKTIHQEIDTLQKNKIKLFAIGDLNSLPEETRLELENAIEATSNNNRLTLILALSYGSRFEILEAVKRIASDVKNGTLEVDNIEESLFESYLYTTQIPNPELLIRTSGELRISNFLLWQIAYSELYFTKKLWPDFRKEDLYKAIVEYQKRERRFGLISQQLLT